MEERRANQEMRTPRSCQERWLLSSLSFVPPLGQTSELQGLSSGAKRNIYFTIVEITDRHTQLHTISATQLSGGEGEFLSSLLR